ncbi:hypothetical protein GGI20_003038 [Coemansia sp. BCRC 34301]|nr:hypothetical protein GGI20_003038 [Coemansia sp. BCRC 34301]
MVAEPNQAYSIDNAISSGDTEINKTDTESSDATFSTSTRYSTAAIDYNSSTTEGEDSIGQSILAKPASSPSIDNQSTFTEMRTSRHKTVYTINYEKLARKYGGVSMRIIQKARAEFFCWSDAVLQAHIRLVYAALPLWQQKKWTALMLAKLRFWHDTTFESAQSTSELLLAQHKIDGLTSPELRNILDTVHIF